MLFAVPYFANYINGTGHKIELENLELLKSGNWMYTNQYT